MKLEKTIKRTPEESQAWPITVKSNQLISLGMSIREMDDNIQSYTYKFRNCKI